MFTGIVTDVGRLLSSEARGGGRRMHWATALDTSDFALGESVAVDGVCLTVDDLGKGIFATDVSPETLQRSTLGAASPGASVNLERALRPVDRLGGHFVLGHVDGVGRLESRKREGEFEVLAFTAPENVSRYLVEKGSVAVDGVSLTVARLTAGGFTVAVIPHTLSRTTLGTRRAGSAVNLEADILGKYVEKLLGGRKVEGPKMDGLNMQKLAESGFLP